jgi:DNA-binding MurR/RpiR family transcriptional regulator
MSISIAAKVVRLANAPNLEGYKAFRLELEDERATPGQHFSFRIKQTEAPEFELGEDVIITVEKAEVLENKPK